VLSRKNGLQFVAEEELDEIEAHPLAHLGKTFARCPVPGCGAPLTNSLPTCPNCRAPICSCGRCQCQRAAAGRTRKSTGNKPRAEKKVEVSSS
jgi:hypothetical protein